MHRDQAWYDMATPEERAQAAGENSGRQQVYNTLLSMYLDEQERLSATGNVHSRDRNQRHAGQCEALVWAAMVTWELEKEAAAERVVEDLQDRICARAD